MMCVGDYEIKYKKVIEKNRCVCTKNSFDFSTYTFEIIDGLMYLYKAFQIDCINASTT